MELDILGIVVLVGSFILFLTIGVPVAFSIGLSALATMLVSFDALPAFATMAQRMATGLESFSLLAIPPSNVLIVYSLASGGVSIAALFMAGYIPGILTGLALMLVGGIYAYRKKYPIGEAIGFKAGINYHVCSTPFWVLN